LCCRTKGLCSVELLHLLLHHSDGMLISTFIPFVVRVSKKLDSNAFNQPFVHSHHTPTKCVFLKKNILLESDSYMAFNFLQHFLLLTLRKLKPEF
jgi:hypothetical protein